jgi:hypothetical protein
MCHLLYTQKVSNTLKSVSVSGRPFTQQFMNGSSDRHEIFYTALSQSSSKMNRIRPELTGFQKAVS